MPTREEKITKDVAEILRDDIAYAPQVNQLVVHDAIQKIIEYFDSKVPPKVIVNVNDDGNLRKTFRIDDDRMEFMADVMASAFEKHQGRAVGFGEIIIELQKGASNINEFIFLSVASYAFLLKKGIIHQVE